MKHLYLLFISTFIFSLSAFSQLSTQEKPRSLRGNVQKSSIELPVANLPAVPVEKLLKEDEEFPTPFRYAQIAELEVDILSDAEITEVANGTVYLYNLKGENAYSLQTTFEPFFLPKGYELYVYNENMMLGAFTSRNNKPYKSLTIQDIPGNELTIELFVPAHAEATNAALTLRSVSQAYRDIFSTKDTKESVFIDINCEEGDNWQLEKHAVAKMTYQRDDGSYLCTGALVNNTAEDGTPYFLTAYHCLNTNESAETLITYFNYERSDCNGLGNAGKTLSGASLKASLDESDFTLLLLDEQPTPDYQPYFAGWNATEDRPFSTVSIHHPNGERKKISVDFDPAFSYNDNINWGENIISPPNSHWVLQFDRGATAGGSSGSPLFNEEGLIIGQLHGGSNNIDFYGKFFYSWNKVPFLAQSLYLWLDPLNKGVRKLQGYFPPDNHPEAHFYVDINPTCKNTPIQLQNKSLFQQGSYEWTISPNSYIFLEGTSNTSEEPVVSFQDEVSYTISLKTTYNNLTDIRIRSNYLEASSTIKISPIDTSAFGLQAGIIEDVYFTGAEQYIINLPEELKLEESSFDTLRFSLNTSVQRTGFLEVPITIIGKHGECSDELTFHIPIIYNDSVELAHELALDTLLGPFNNILATTQPNEPVPNGDDCFSQIEWCSCNVSDTILENSVWFTFTAPQSGIVGINTKGFDNQIALYDAESAEDLLSGDETKYSLIAASDDVEGISDFSASIFKAVVTPGKQYWLQVDGSACGAEGEFYVKIIDEEYIPTNTAPDLKIQEETIQIYPNPVKNTLNISIGEEDETIEKIIFLDQTGKVLKVHNSEDKYLNSHNLNFTPGIYLLKIITNKKIHTKKFIVE